ncbi:MAG: CpsD/CapB family tyrosine-protein kinase [Acetivibrionales bacterium]|jgi:protein-tyrosine kinase
MKEYAENIRFKLNNPAEEAYKVLRTNIQFYELDKKFKTLAITSYSPGEGKTTTAVYLAVSMAKSGEKVLLVDADMRKPVLMKQLAGSSYKGLSNILAGNAALDETVNATSVNGFNFITCGVKPPNPVEMLESQEFEKFLKSVSEKFDVVIIDTPPLGSVIDSAIIASKTDGVLIVIKPNIVRRENVEMVKEQLEKVNARILGVVLNNMSKQEYKSYYSGFDYYGNGRKYRKEWIKQLKSSK